MAEDLRAYNWDMFDSGGRSIHLHIQLHPMFGPDVPRMQKAWMKKNYPRADLSIYRTAGIYRLTGTYHEKNAGHSKTLLESNRPGEALKLQVELPAPPPPSAYENHDTELEDALLYLMGRNVSSGTSGRNYHVFKMGRVCERMGMDIGSAFEYAARWNSQRCLPPLGPSSVISTIESAYKGTGK
jgi:hypothetical protein